MSVLMLLGGASEPSSNNPSQTDANGPHDKFILLSVTQLGVATLILNLLKKKIVQLANHSAAAVKATNHSAEIIKKSILEYQRHDNFGSAEEFCKSETLSRSLLIRRTPSKRQPTTTPSPPSTPAS